MSRTIELSLHFEEFIFKKFSASIYHLPDSMLGTGRHGSDRSLCIENLKSRGLEGGEIFAVMYG